nr:hypothetical protein [Mycobacterium tuberculosis]
MASSHNRAAWLTGGNAQLIGNGGDGGDGGGAGAPGLGGRGGLLLGLPGANGT